MKILPTIGPATEKGKDLKYLFNYCSMARLNTSVIIFHGIKK